MAKTLSSESPKTSAAISPVSTGQGAAPGASRDSLKQLREDLSAIEQRLGKADAATKRSITALRKSFSALSENALGKVTPASGQASGPESDQAELAAYVDKLADKLTADIKAARADMAGKLSAAVDTGEVHTIALALGEAEKRLANAELNQAQSIQKINVHIARLASALDARLQTQSREHGAQQAALSARITQVETDASDAILGFGAKVEDLAGELTRRIDQSETRFQERLADTAMDLQQDMDAHRRGFERRIESLEQRGAANDGLALTRLDARLEALEASLMNVLQGQVSAQASAQERSSVPAFPEAPQAPQAPETHPSSEPRYAAPLFSGYDDGPSQKSGSHDPQNGPMEFDPAAYARDAFSAAPEAPHLAPAARPASYGANVVSPAAFHGGAQGQTPPPYPHSPNPYGSVAAQQNYAAQSFAGYDTNPYAEAAYGHGAAAQLSPQFSPQFNNALGDAPRDPEAAPQSHQIGAPSANLDAHPDAHPGAQPGSNPGAHLDRHYDELPPLYGLEDQNGVNPYAPPPFTDGHSPSETMNNARPGAGPHGGPHAAKGGARNNLLRTALTGAALVGLVTAGGLFVKNKILDGAPPAQPEISGRKSAQTPKGPAEQNPEGAALNTGEATGALEGVGTGGVDVEFSEATGQMSNPETSPAALSKNALSKIDVAALDTLQAAVEAGHPLAQLQLGLSLLQQGKFTEGADLIRRSATQGTTAAQYYLGDLYETGKGVTADPKLARDLTLQAARGGHRVAMYQLAGYYADDAQSGRGDPQAAMGKAAQWFRKAAEFGMADAQYNLAVLYDQGNGVIADKSEAYVWYAIAGGLGDQESSARAAQLREELSGDARGRADARIAGFVPAAINEEANGYFVNSNLPWNKPSEGANRAQAKTVQTLLTALGYNIGPADGSIGPKTRAAIKDFQNANGLTPSGNIDAALIDKLKAASGA